MHIPDGFLAAHVWAPAWLVSLMGVSYCLRKTSRLLQDRMVSLMGVMSAFIFAGQMLNFPVVAGTSGHLMGGVLAAVLLGPYAGALVMATVLVVQCLIFADGGLTALGANILNMSLVGTMVGYGMYAFLRRCIGGPRGVMISVAIASWVSVVLASGMCSLELAASGTSPLRIVLSAMAGVHALIGIGEAIITCLVVGFVLQVRPDLLYKN